MIRSSFTTTIISIAIIILVTMLILFFFFSSFMSYASSSSSSSYFFDSDIIPSVTYNPKEKHETPEVDDGTTTKKEDEILKQQKQKQKRRQPRVAIAALLTSNSKQGEALYRAIDSLAVLRRSIEEVTPSKIFKHFDFLTLLTHSVDSRWIPVLKKLGWTKHKIYEKAPIDASEIKNPQIAKEIVTDGAIGIDELIKLNVFDFGDEYDIVLLLDCDIIFHKRFDYSELLQQTGKALRWTKGGWISEKINGGFLVIEPKGKIGKLHKNKMLDIIREGDFRPGLGYGGKCCWTYGGRTIQGILPYYFLYYLGGDFLSSSSSSSSSKINKKQENLFINTNKKKNSSSSQRQKQQEVDEISVFSSRDDLQLDRCKYNNMDQLPECKAFPFKNIVSNHFTGDCAKPWWCGGQKRSSRCKFWMRRWLYLYGLELKRHNVLLEDIEMIEVSCPENSMAKVLFEKVK